MKYQFCEGCNGLLYPDDLSDGEPYDETLVLRCHNPKCKLQWKVTDDLPKHNLTDDQVKAITLLIDGYLKEYTSAPQDIDKIQALAYQIGYIGDNLYDQRYYDPWKDAPYQLTESQMRILNDR